MQTKSCRSRIISPPWIYHLSKKPEQVDTDKWGFMKKHQDIPRWKKRIFCTSTQSMSDRSRLCFILKQNCLAPSPFIKGLINLVKIETWKSWKVLVAEAAFLGIPHQSCAKSQPSCQGNMHCKTNKGSVCPSICSSFSSLLDWKRTKDLAPHPYRLLLCW